MTQPIEMRMNEMISGVRSDVAAILYGDDLDLMVEKASEIERVLKSIDGAADVKVEQVTGQPVLQIKIKQDEIARYGIPAKTVLDLVESLGSKHVGEVYEGQLRFPLVIRLPETARADPEAIGSILVATPAGERIPLSRLATSRRWKGRTRSNGNGINGGSRSKPTSAGGTWAALWPKPRRRSMPKSRCRPAAITSSGAGSSRTCSGHKPG